MGGGGDEERGEVEQMKTSSAALGICNAQQKSTDQEPDHSDLTFRSLSDYMIHKLMSQM